MVRRSRYKTLVRRFLGNCSSTTKENISSLRLGSMWVRQVPSINIAYNREAMISLLKRPKIFGPLQVTEDVLNAFPMSFGRPRIVPSKQIDGKGNVRPCTICEVHECANCTQVGEFWSQNFLPLFLRPERVLILL